MYKNTRTSRIVIMQNVLIQDISKDSNGLSSYLLKTYRNNTVSNESYVLPNATSGPLPDPWGPKRDPLSIVIPITVVYVLTLISGVIGNVSTCIVIVRTKAMHTATNYYLFSLAISDLLLLLSGLPPEIYNVWSKYPYIFGEAFCVLQGLAAETSANATVLTITAFTVERYLAICHPFVAHTLSKLSRAIKFIIGIWVVALCLAIPPAMAFGIVYDKLDDGTIIKDHCMCMIKRSWIPHAFEISTFVFFVGPMTLITILYVFIGIQLHKSTVTPSRSASIKMKHRIYKPVVAYNQPAETVVVLKDGEGAEKTQNVNSDDSRKNFSKNAQATKHVVKMLIAVVVAFFICWAPFHAQRLLAVYGDRTSAGMISAFQTLTYISGVFYYLSTTVNPLLYHIMSHKFREAFKQTFRELCCRKRRSKARGRSYATLSARSSQINSHSNTDSYSRQSSLRYLNTEVARVHEGRRPLVVSFRRKLTATTHKRQKRFTAELDEDLQEALKNLKEQKRNGYVENRSNLTDKMTLLRDVSKNTRTTDCSFVEVHNVQEPRICPMSATDLPSLNDIKIENMDIFQEKLLNLHKDQSNTKSLSGSPNCKRIGEFSEPNLCKSCTMPNIGTMFCSVDIKRHDENRVDFVSVSSNIHKPKKEFKYVSSVVSSQYSDSIAIHVN